MNSPEWDERGWTKVKNPSGEMVRTKIYQRKLISFVNTMPENIEVRKKLAELLQVPFEDLLGDLDITIDIMKFKNTTKEYRKYLKG